MLSLLDQIDRAVIGIDRPVLAQLEHSDVWSTVDDADVRAWYEAEYLVSKGAMDEAVSRFRTLVDRRDVSPAVRLRAISGLAATYAALSRPEPVDEVMRNVDVDRVEHLGYRARLVRVLALAASMRGDYATAAVLGERAADDFATERYHAVLGNTYTELATAYHRLGRLQEAIRAQYRAHEAFTESGSPLAQAISLVNLGVIHGEAGNAEGARSYFMSARAIPLEVDGDRIELWCSLNLGLLAIERNDADAAIPELTMAHELGERMQMWSTVVGACRGLAAAYRIKRDVASARRWMERATEILERTPHDGLRTTNIIEEARIAAVEGDHDRVLRLTEPLLEASQASGDMSTRVRVAQILSETYAAMGNHANAYTMLRERMELQTLISNDSVAQQLTMMRVEADMRSERDMMARERALLHGLMPATVANRIVRGESDIAEVHDNVVVMFADIVDFTSLAARLDAPSLLRLMNDVFSLFDDAVRDHGLVRIKTIGDAYMTIANAPDPHPDPVGASAQCALAMRDRFVATFPDLSIRIGIHVGAVIAGVVGRERPMFDVWGDTVNVASRMESTGEAGRIHASSSFALAINGEMAKGRNGEMVVMPRGEVHIKGKGPMTTFWLEGAA